MPPCDRMERRRDVSAGHRSHHNANLYRKTGRDKEAEAPRPAIFYGRGRWGACGPRRRKHAVCISYPFRSCYKKIISHTGLAVSQSSYASPVIKRLRSPRWPRVAMQYDGKTLPHCFSRSLHDCRKIPIHCARLSQMGRGYMMYSVSWYTCGHFDAASRTEERRAAAMTASATYGHATGRRSPPTLLAFGAEGLVAWHRSRWGGRRHNRDQSPTRGM